MARGLHGEKGKGDRDKTGPDKFISDKQQKRDAEANPSGYELFQAVPKKLPWLPLNY